MINLAEYSLDLLARAVMVLGHGYVSVPTGVDLNKEALTEADINKLVKFQSDNESKIQADIQNNSKNLLATLLAGADTSEARRIADTQQARNRELEILKLATAPWLQRNIAPILALLAIVATFALYFIIIFFKVGLEKDAREITLLILGAINATATMILGYYFGSSAGSKEKQDIMKSMMNDHNGNGAK